MEIKLDGKSLTIEQVEKVARDWAKVSVTPGAKKAVDRCRKTVEKLIAEGQLIYGVTTGIGEFARVKVDPAHGAELQKRIVYSHAAGYGDHAKEDHVRAGMLLRANVLSKGHSAVRFSTLETLVKMINRGIIPVIYEKGSVGTSGDLSPLSQMAEVAMGEGMAYYKGRLMKGATAMKKAKIKPVDLSFKEGLGLINGSQFFTGLGALNLIDAIRLVKTAMISSAMTIDALNSPTKAYDRRLHDLRPYNGQRVVARNIRKLIAGSKIQAQGSKKVQDAYSLRCTPQVYGPFIDAISYARSQVEIEMNSVADNPIFVPKDGAHLAGGNFHGEPIGLVLDLVCMAITDLGNLSERHTNRLLNPSLSKLPDFLVKGDPGLNSGLMVAQYTAASLISENKVLSHPAIVDNFSLAADQEDHVCMGPVSAYKLRQIIYNTIGVVAIEFMCGAQAIDFQGKKPGRGTNPAYKVIRKYVDHLDNDRVLYPDIEKIAAAITSGEILDAVEKAVGPIMWEWDEKRA